MRIVPREEVARRWRSWAQERQKRSPRRGSRPRVVNTQTARGLTDTRERVFRGRRYRVPPLGFEDAARILEHMQTLQRIQSEPSPSWSEMTAWYRRAASLAKRCARPANPLRRLLWPITPNPFRKGTLQEVADLLGFICGWVMIDLDPPETTNGDRPGTSQATSRGS